jgi:hypothetical protein
MIAVITGLASLVSAATALAQPTFPVMNTSETAPDGVYFRPGPDPTVGPTTVGIGVYANEHVRVKCFWNGAAVGSYNNPIWYYAYDVERPTVGGRSNEGWINTHYVKDDMTAGNAAPGVPGCATGSSDGGTVPGDDGDGGGGSDDGENGASAPSPASAYFSPFKKGQFELADHSAFTVYINEFATDCKTPNPAFDRATALAGASAITTLAGWSKGRVGVLDYLKVAESKAPDRVKQLNYIIMLDPGAYGEMECDRKLDAGNLLATWLRTNPAARLVVISTTEVTQLASSKGIQKVYFNDIRDQASRCHADLRSRVLTCNYGLPADKGNTAHERAFLTGQYYIQHQIGKSTSSCPRLSEKGRVFPSTAGWHP